MLKGFGTAVLLDLANNGKKEKIRMAPISDFQPFQTGSPQVGTITQWEDEKGFGWVKSGDKRVFVHIKEFERGQRRPKAGAL